MHNIYYLLHSFKILYVLCTSLCIVMHMCKNEYIYFFVHVIRCNRMVANYLFY